MEVQTQSHDISFENDLISVGLHLSSVSDIDLWMSPTDDAFSADVHLDTSEDVSDNSLYDIYPFSTHSTDEIFTYENISTGTLVMNSDVHTLSTPITNPSDTAWLDLGNSETSQDTTTHRLLPLPILQDSLESLDRQAHEALQDLSVPEQPARVTQKRRTKAKPGTRPCDLKSVM